MKWDKYTIKTIVEAEDILSAALSELGIEGIQIEDNVPLSQEDKEKLFIDILPQLPEDNGLAYVSFFLESGNNHDELLKQVQEELENIKEYMDIGEASIEHSETKDVDWINNWKEFFKPFSIDDIYIKPTWEPVTSDANGKTIIELDPGTAFGTGKHETTRLCVSQLKKYITPNCKVLDVGCGSGILSIVSLKEGAGLAHGIDVDENAVKVSNENCEINQLQKTEYHFEVGNIIEDQTLQERFCQGEYDIVAANILADIIMPLTPVIPACLKKGGIYITSGILNTKEAAVSRKLQECEFKILEISRQGDWVAITAQK